MVDINYKLGYPPNGLEFDMPQINLGNILGSTGTGGKGFNVGSLLSDSIPFAGAIGGLLDGFLNFGKSPVGAFYADANKFKDVVLPRLKSQYSNDLSKMFTEMSKAVEYMLLHYTAHRTGSSSPHSIKGNQEGLDIIKEIRQSLYASADSLKPAYSVTYKVKSKSYPKGYISEIGSFNGNHDGSYRDYQIVKMKKYTAPKKAGVPDEPTEPKSGLSWLLLPVVAVVGLIVWLFTKKK